MVNFDSVFRPRPSRSSTTSTANYSKSRNQNFSTIIIVVTVGIVLIAIVLVGYRIYHELYTKKKQKNRRQSICSRRVLSVFPVHNDIVSDSRGVSPIYSVPVRNNTISFVREDSPPDYYTVVELQQGQSDSLTRL